MEHSGDSDSFTVTRMHKLQSKWAQCTNERVSFVRQDLNLRATFGKDRTVCVCICITHMLDIYNTASPSIFYLYTQVSAVNIAMSTSTTYLPSVRYLPPTALSTILPPFAHNQTLTNHSPFTHHLFITSPVDSSTTTSIPQIVVHLP